MVKSITFLSQSGRQPVLFQTDFGNEINIDCLQFQKQSAPFDIEIVFSEKISAFRNHNYTWADLRQNRVANSFSPKIIQLSNGFYVQANTNQGIWEVKKNNPKQLLWRFSPVNAAPLACYTGRENHKKIAAAKNDLVYSDRISLLFSQKGAVELSRSKIPFAATACFTDHCDFDTPGNLKKQREFFKANGIKVTKGFFLNHFSKRADNASWENESAELKLWQEDGHELCYHSLSQSIRPKPESLTDFYQFSPPVAVKTWIDHGYQPYNLSLYQKEGLNETDFAENLDDKGIRILWNYIDSGTATAGVLNQMEPAQFTLGAFKAGMGGKSFQKQLSLLIKNAIVHFYADEKLIKKYARLASDFKQKRMISFFQAAFGLGWPLLKLILRWNSLKGRPYPLARFQNLFFTHTIAGHRFTIFQTLELLDFKAALSKKSVDNFIDESGLFIAHTYFSVPMAYHDGRIFTTDGTINPAVADNFAYLGRQIAQQKIWNPTLNELVAHWLAFNAAEFKVDENGAIRLKDATTIPYRNIS